MKEKEILNLEIREIPMKSAIDVGESDQIGSSKFLSTLFSEMKRWRSETYFQSQNIEQVSRLRAF